jgi:hypothetical protein
MAVWFYVNLYYSVMAIWFYVNLYYSVMAILDIFINIKEHKFGRELEVGFTEQDF